jgi:Leucine-rich repeat (LRR) protein
VPEALRALVKLRLLKLGSNQLETVPAGLGELSCLRTLELQKNQLGGGGSGGSGGGGSGGSGGGGGAGGGAEGAGGVGLPRELGSLLALEVLLLQENQLHSVPMELCRLTALHKVGTYLLLILLL